MIRNRSPENNDSLDGMLKALNEMYGTCHGTPQGNNR
jgi:hypothetical protein